MTLSAGPWSYVLASVMNRTRRTAKRIRAELRKADARARADRETRCDRARLTAMILEADNHKRRLPPPPVPAARELFEVVRERAPGLMTQDMLPALSIIGSLPHSRPIREWQPRTKGRNSRFHSLVTHLFAKCPAPPVLWEGFFDVEAAKLAPLIVWVASGGSLFQYAKARFPIPLTRKMCHLALASYDTSLLRAIRRAQVIGLGGDKALAQAWAASVHASQIMRRRDETFFVTVLDWLTSRDHAPLDVPIILDYVAARHAEDGRFSMKGRTVPALLRDARVWHADLARLRGVRQTIFQPSGFRALEHELPKKQIVWRVEEVLTSKDLFDEGRRMGHCVYSYSHAAQSGATSIWTMTMEDGTGPTGRWAMLTIEVRNQLRVIVQARGRFNRMPSDDERKILARFAAMNNLSIAC